ncbi:PilW family protein [Lysobacter enzymogenes]|uniref:PilW family protein n=1 Tax=Lysobacter enzymogenes TaxID=69 RepID=UPI00384F578D
MNRRAQTGLSLVELMVALALSAVLAIGLLQIFGAARTSYKLSEGLARVQENGRFAVDYLQRDLRMAGHMGCSNDQARFLAKPLRFSSTFIAEARPSEAQLSAAPPELRFDLMLQGFEANGTGPGGSVTLPAAAAWSGAPALPAYLSALAPVAGSDVVVLRYFSPESIPVKSVDGAALVVDSKKWAEVIKAGYSGGDAPGLLAIADCMTAGVFDASKIEDSGSDTRITVAAGGLNKSVLDLSAFSIGQAMLFRAEVQAYYVGINSAGRPTLYRARFGAAPGAAAVGLIGDAPEPVAEGIENMQLIFGQDNQTDSAVAPSGFISTQAVASTVQSGADTTPWRRVGLVQVAMLSRSTDGAGTSQDIAPEPPRLLGVAATVPADQRYRAVYESTVALRNRLYGN